MRLRVSARRSFSFLSGGALCALLLSCADSTGPAPTVPGAPVITGITGADGQLSIDFTKPADDGGAPLLRIEYSMNAGASWIVPSPVDTTSPLVVTGLTNAVGYQVQLRAVNRVGPGPGSATVLGSPRTTPGLPTVTSVTPGDGQLSVAFNPIPENGAGLTNIEYRLSAGGAWVARAPAGTASPLVIAGLSNGTSYDVSIRGVNVMGSGTASVPVTATPRTVPDQPVISGITPGDQQLSVAFGAINDRGAPITNIEYRLNAGAWITRAPASAASPLVITGLTNGSEYAVSIRAVNAAGVSNGSADAAATPRAVPGAPTISGITAGNAQLSVAFGAIPDGGAALSNIEYQLNAGAWVARTPASTASPLLITGLSNATTYEVRIRGVNAAGTGAASNAVSGTPFTVPSAPNVFLATGGYRSVSVQFAPTSNGGSPILGYQYDLNTSNNWISLGNPPSPAMIGGLSDGTAYTVRLRAINAAGTGAASGTAGFTTAPSTPSVIVADADSNRVFICTSNVATASSFRFYESSVSTDTGSFLGTATGSNCFSRPSPPSGAVLYYRSRACNTSCSPPSNPTTGTLTRLHAPTITGVSFLNFGATLVVSFTIPSAVSGGGGPTNVAYSTNNGASWTVRSPASPNTPITIPSPGGSFAIRLIVINNDGASLPSDPWVVTP